MNRKITRVLCALVGAGTVFAAASSAAPTQNSRFQRVQLLSQPAAKVLPLSLDKTPVTVVAILAGPSVANAQESAGRKLSRAERQAIKTQRRSEQSGKRAQIEAVGGRVI